jgi:hypothetical protein
MGNPAWSEVGDVSANCRRIEDSGMIHWTLAGFVARVYGMPWARRKFQDCKSPLMHW